jgi:hypothetical protein
MPLGLNELTGLGYRDEKKWHVSLTWRIRYGTMTTTLPAALVSTGRPARVGAGTRRTLGERC